MHRALLVLLLPIAGCASFSDTPIAGYSQGGTTTEQLQRDGAACQLEGERIRNNQGFGGLAGVASTFETRNRAFDACMRMKGYTPPPT